MGKDLDKSLIRRNLTVSLKYDTWDLANKYLYLLCKEHPQHKNIDEIIAKLWLIGRSYSASLERRKNKKENDGEFYEEIAAPVIKKSNLDGMLRSLKKYQTVNLDNADVIIATHEKLTMLFKKITDQEKSSLASKYLHFHFPDLFFIMDSRVKSAFKLIIPNFRLKHKEKTEYGKFVKKCLFLREYIKINFKKNLNPRELDTLLLTIENNEN